MPQLKRQLKQYIARDSWSMNDFIMMYNHTNDLFIKAYELITQKDLDKLLMKE